MNDFTLKSRLLGVLRNILRSESVGEDAAFGITFEWDSLKHIEVILGIEREFGIKVGPAGVMSLTSVVAIADFLNQQGLSDVPE